MVRFSLHQRQNGYLVYISTTTVGKCCCLFWPRFSSVSLRIRHMARSGFSKKKQVHRGWWIWKKIVKRGPVRPSRRDNSGWENNASHELDRCLCRLGVQALYQISSKILRYLFSCANKYLRIFICAIACETRFDKRKKSQVAFVEVSLRITYVD